MKSSFDVTFIPCVNVKAKVINPYHLTDEEISRIVDIASTAISEQFQDKINEENLAEIRIYQKNMDKPDETTDDVVFDSGLLKKNPGTPLKEALDILIDLSNSSYIPFDSPCPSSTEVKIKENVLKAITCLRNAIEFNNILYKSSTINASGGHRLHYADTTYDVRN